MHVRLLKAKEALPGGRGWGVVGGGRAHILHDLAVRLLTSRRRRDAIGFAQERVLAANPSILPGQRWIAVAFHIHRSIIPTATLSPGVKPVFRYFRYRLLASSYRHGSKILRVTLFKFSRVTCSNIDIFLIQGACLSLRELGLPTHFRSRSDLHHSSTSLTTFPKRHLRFSRLYIPCRAILDPHLCRRIREGST